MVFLTRATVPPRATRWIGATTGDPLGLVLLTIIYVKAYFEFNPFQAKKENWEIDTSGSLTTQLIWLGIVAFAGLVTSRNLTTAISLLRRVWPIALPFLWFAATLLWTGDSTLTTRRLILLIFMTGAAFAVAASRPSPSDFLRVTLLVVGPILAINVLSVIAVPHLARDGPFFVGIYTGKNTAGAVAAVIFVFWLFAALWARQLEFKIVCLAGALMAVFFLVGSWSKTSMGAAAVSPFLGIGLYHVLGQNLLWRVVSYTAFFVVSCFAVWLFLFFNLTLEQIGLFIFSDLTFTGRTFLWEYVWRSIEESYWLGHGYGAFWYVGKGVPNLLGAESGWPAVTTSAHNGYLNIWLEAGLVGLLLCGLTMLLAVRGALQLLKYLDAPAGDRWVYALVLAQLILLMLRDMMEASLYKSGASTTMVFFMLYFLIEMWRRENEENHNPASPDHQAR